MEIKSSLMQRTHQELVLLGLSALAIICISPFIFIRYANNEFDVAIIDTIATLVIMSFFIFVYKTRKVKIASFSIAVLSMAIVLVDIYLSGHTVIYWFYPTLIATYYLTPYKIALKISLLATCILMLIIYPLVHTLEFTVVVFTTLLMNMFSYLIFHSVFKAQIQLQQLATTDTLTGCGNRRALEIQLSELINRHSRSLFPLCLIIFDLDHFKEINDKYGHIIGDHVLKDICQIVENNTRSFEKIYRYGGEEFIILPLEVEISNAIRIANKLRNLIENNQFTLDAKLTISLGVAQYKQYELAENWIRRADIALYEAKNSGRNKVVAAN